MTSDLLSKDIALELALHSVNEVHVKRIKRCKVEASQKNQLSMGHKVMKVKYAFVNMEYIGIVLVYHKEKVTLTLFTPLISRKGNPFRQNSQMTKAEQQIMISMQ